MKITHACALSLGLLAFGFAGQKGTGATDRLASEVQRCVSLASDASAGDEFTRSIRSGSLPPLKQVEADLAAGRRWAALHRLASLRLNLEGAAYVDGLAAKQREQAGFEQEWKRVGARLAKDGLHTEAFGALRTAALRAEAEATLPQANILLEASLEYARNTETQFGLFYLGSALAANDFVELCGGFETQTARPAPPLRSIRRELDALGQLLLAAYRPPASVDRHAEFIGASSALKEARALDALGRRHAALLRYATACARSAPLIDSTPAPSAEELAKLLDAFSARIEADDVDHSIAQVFLELARAEIAAAPGTNPPIAAAIATHSLPRYFAALEPAVPPAATAKPEVDVTLVRWPFT